MSSSSQEVLTGSSVTFTKVYTNSAGMLVDPEEVTFSVVRVGTIHVYGPYTYTGGTVERLGPGQYSKEITFESVVTPGNYSGKWVADVDGSTTVELQPIQVVDPLPEPSTILDPPRIYGVIRETPTYQQMGMGTTDRLLLIGHGAGLSINDPFQVVNMRETMNLLGADSDSPLVRGLLEAYSAGARDIWIMIAAPMDEYIPYDPTNHQNRLTPNSQWGGLTYYQRYKERLDTTYDILEDFDFPEMIVPLEAPFYYTGGVDFLTQLMEKCESQYLLSGNPCMGILGTRIPNWTLDDVEAMGSDERLPTIGGEGKFCMVIFGEAAFNLVQMPTSHQSSLAATAAATLGTKPMNRGLTYQHMRNAVTLVGRDLTESELRRLANARINSAIRTQKGKRGHSYQVVIASDNTLSTETSSTTGNITDYWSITQMRLVTKVIQAMKATGKRYLGSVGYAQLRQEYDDYLTNLVVTDQIRGYSFNMYRDIGSADAYDVRHNPDLAAQGHNYLPDPSKVSVEVSLQPYIGVREIAFEIEVGPNT